ncbi:MAG: DegT/DnrJ/EryC1/StrS family aminotransferase [Alphaproteobacteria bacterium]|nr:DegT/DnrJ/EryC1/StrS family aminotransferase [Alphaproteobacteria bacterium]
MSNRFRIPFRDLSVNDAGLRRDLAAAMERVLVHGQLMMGPETEQLERELAKRCGAPHCVAVGSGTSALYLALKVLGIGRGDEVITTAMSWIATATAIVMTGATPVYADIGDDLNIDPAAIEDLITARTKAIVPVHYFGRMCDMLSIMALARRHKLIVIEDAAQAFGAQLAGATAGTAGDVGAFSINPMKALQSLGEAGAITFKDESLGGRLRALRYLGAQDRQLCVSPELNHKISEIQSAFIRVYLSRFEAARERRRAMAQAYIDGLKDVVTVPKSESDRSAYFDFTIDADRRDDLKVFLEARGIEPKIRYALLLPDHPGLAADRPVRAPRARALAQRILSLPMEPQMSNDAVNEVVTAVRNFYRGEVP